MKSTYLLAIGLLISYHSTLKAQEEWREINLPQFKIYYTDKDQDITASLSNSLKTSLAELSQKLGLQPTEPITVYLCSSNKVFAELTGNNIPHWGAGIAEASQSLIVLKSPKLTDDYPRFPKLVRHELVHILIGQSAQSVETLPRWFGEGIAILLSNDEEFGQGEAISKALISDSIIPLDEIDNVLKFQQAKAKLAYEESYSFIIFLQEKFGSPRLMDLVKSLPAYSSFRVAFVDILGVDIFDMELEWYEYLESKYRWRFLLDFEIFLWIFILFLFIFAFVGIRLRNRRIMKRWETEELTDPPW